MVQPNFDRMLRRLLRRCSVPFPVFPATNSSFRKKTNKNHREHPIFLDQFLLKIN
jgi:hypothetical protein